MKEKYQAPQIEFLDLQNDVVRTSGIVGEGSNKTQFVEDLSPDEWFGN